LALPKRSDTTPLLTRILPDAHPKRVERGAAAGKAQGFEHGELMKYCMSGIMNHTLMLVIQLLPIGQLFQDSVVQFY
jgi:hypothetical protein